MDLKKIFGFKKEEKKVDNSDKDNLFERENKNQENEDEDLLSHFNELTLNESDISEKIIPNITDRSKNPLSNLKDKLTRKKQDILEHTKSIKDEPFSSQPATVIEFDKKEVKEVKEVKISESNNKEPSKMTDNKNSSNISGKSLKKILNAVDSNIDNKNDDFKRKSEQSIAQNDEYKEVLSENEKFGDTFSFSDSLMQLNKKKLPFIGNFSLNKQYAIIGSVITTSFLCIVLGGVLYNNALNKDNNIVQVSSTFSSNLQKLNLYFKETTLGKNEAYSNLIKTKQTVQEDFNKIKESTGIIKNDNVTILENNIQGYLNEINNNINTVHLQSEILINSNNKVKSFNEETNIVNIDIDNFIKNYTQQNLSQNELANVYSLKTNLQAMNGAYSTILLSEQLEITYFNNLDSAKRAFKASLIALQIGDTNRAINPIHGSTLNDYYQKIINDWLKLSTKADIVLNKANDLIKIRSLSFKNEQIINNLNKNIDDITIIYKNEDVTGKTFIKLFIFVSLILLLMAILIIFNIYAFEKNNRSVVEQIENNKNESSILKLLTEMMPLQNGDLTKKTTVSEEITGAIADSINATIDSLASLVKKIKDTSFLMNKKTNEVNLISVEMLEATEKQASSLNETGTSVIDIANAISEISYKTQKGADEAKKSVQVSEEGAKQVQDSVKSMREINTNMNETVVLMNKVRNSSRQISTIIELLSDITEETSILALNATVQAAKAGESGKGFKIVADSIQELSDKASDAARRVATLISTVQTDIEAVEKAIDKTNEEVDHGVTLSELAGNSLNKITIVSKELSQIVGVISEDAKSHANVAKKISENMKDILNTTEENKKSTEKTARSISEISEISNELGKSVQSFKIKLNK